MFMTSTTYISAVVYDQLPVCAHISLSMVPRPVVILRVSCLVLFAATTVSIVISWHSLLSFILLLVSLFVVGNKEEKSSHKHTSNPYKFIKAMNEQDLSPETQSEITQKILNYLTYNAESCDVIQNFELLKQQTECTFAKKSHLWGSATWNDTLGFELNVVKTLPTFFYFTTLCSQVRLDGFVFELPGKIYGTSAETFGHALKKLLKVLSDNDPAHGNCINQRLDSSRWVFEFDKKTFFITSFAPFYPDTCSRYSFGSENCYVLFQPEISFARHDLPLDTIDTNWSNPKTVRDRIRLAFRDAGRGYEIRGNNFPMIRDIVKPMNGSSHEWWINKEEEDVLSYRVFDT